MGTRVLTLGEANDKIKGMKRQAVDRLLNISFGKIEFQRFVSGKDFLVIFELDCRLVELPFGRIVVSRLTDCRGVIFC